MAAGFVECVLAGCGLLLMAAALRIGTARLRPVRVRMPRPPASAARRRPR